MKKLFVSLMAVAALVSCSKDNEEGIALDSKNKTVEITILNAVEGSRAGTEGGVTAAGAVGACAEATDLKILFADANGTVLNELPLTGQAATDPHPEASNATDVGTYTPGKMDGGYIWHNVPWQVTQIAVIRYEEGDFKAEDGTAINTIGLDLEDDIAPKASNEAINIDRSVDDIILYATSTLSDTNETHRVNDILYHVWTADVTVAPKFARFEISRLECSDLGDANNDGNSATYGFDRLNVTALTWNSKYTAKDFAGVLAAGEDTNYMEPEDGVWSWNVLPTTFTGLVVDMTAEADSYAISSPNVPLKVTGLSHTGVNGEVNNTFAAENIYQLDLTFTEANIIDPEGLCVTVTVTIKPWAVKTVYPVFQNN